MMFIKHLDRLCYEQNSVFEARNNTKDKIIEQLLTRAGWYEYIRTAKVRVLVKSV